MSFLLQLPSINVEMKTMEVKNIYYVLKLIKKSYCVIGPDGCLQYFREPTGVVSR